jgi:hypothetical protein
MKIKEFKNIKELFEIYGDDTDTIEKQMLKFNHTLTLKDSIKKITIYLQELRDLNKPLITRFKIGEVEFGLIPCLEEISTAEWIDISNNENITQNINKVMAILYRPIKYSLGNKYEIESYEGTDKYAAIMDEVDADIYLGASLFFLNLNKILLKDLVSTTQKKLMKEQKRIKQEG